MHPLFLAANAIEHGTDGVGDASGEKQIKPGLCQHLHDHLGKGDNGPAHTDVADHGEDPVLLQVDGRQHCGNDGHDPLEAKEKPAQLRIDGPDGRQGNDGVGAANEKIDGAVVDDLHDLLAHAGPQTVVDAGYTVKDDHAEAVDGGADDSVDVAVLGCQHNAHGQSRHAHGSAHNMGDGIHDLFAGAIVRKLPVSQLGSFQHTQLPPWVLCFHYSTKWRNVCLQWGLYSSTPGRDRFLLKVEKEKD